MVAFISYQKTSANGLKITHFILTTMKLKLLFITLVWSLPVFCQTQTLSLHPTNPHYFLFRNKPTILITSAEHYGAVINLDFDYIKYLDELQSNGLNYTRIFSGAYIELPGAFGITKNNLAPKPGRLICPWERSRKPGYKNGGNKFNLDQWNKHYFARLSDFVSNAAKRNIVVEMTLFSSVYSDEGWKGSPLHVINNISIKDSTARRNIQTLNNGELLKYQEAMVRKIVSELKRFDNVFYEIQNEPWADFGIKVLDLDRKEENLHPWQRIVEKANPESLAWQKHMVAVIVKEEAKQKTKHLIAQNFTNFQYNLQEVNPDVSILNFHYALPAAALENYGLNKVTGFDESGFSGDKDETYRKQAWRFIMSGGGLFNSLDYSFTTDSPDGMEVQKAPGGGSRTLRRQLKVLKDFMEGFDFLKMKPVAQLKSNENNYIVYQLAEAGKQYAFYFEEVGGSKLSLQLPAGSYAIDIISVEDGSKKFSGRKDHKGGNLELDIPAIKTFALKAVAR